MDTFFVLFAVLTLIGSVFPAESVMMQLPQAIVSAKQEENLKCLLNVMRQFDFKRTASDLAPLNHLQKYLNPGVDRPIDLNTLLLQYFNLQDIDDKDTGAKFLPRKMINDCKLNMAPAIARCQTAYKATFKCKQVIYGNDEFNLAPFVTPSCPDGFQQYGSSKCVRKCAYTNSIEIDVEQGETLDSPFTKTTYCLKKKSVISSVKKLEPGQSQKVGENIGDYAMIEEKEGEFVYIQNCPKDFMRLGNRTCVAKCPLGWPDLGAKCLKKGEMIFFPFVWTPGDGNLEGGDSGSKASSTSKPAAK